jgi:hypothetical protein
VLESGLEPYSGGGACSQEWLHCVLPWYEQPKKNRWSTLGRVQADSKVWTTFPLDEKAPVFNGMCWSLAGKDYQASDWAQLRGRKKEDLHHRETRQTQQKGGGHSESWTSRSEPGGINSHR